jgi:hypothetical protein
MSMAMLARCREAKKCTGIFPMHSIGKTDRTVSRGNAPNQLAAYLCWRRHAFAIKQFGDLPASRNYINPPFRSAALPLSLVNASPTKRLHIFQLSRFGVFLCRRFGVNVDGRQHADPPYHINALLVKRMSASARNRFCASAVGE